MVVRLSVWVLAGLLLSCTYGPDLEDGQIACGSAGCPGGMVCADDGFCYEDPPPGSDATPFALAVANNGAPDRIYALCGGQLISAWESPGPTASTSATFADLDGDGSPELLFGDAGGVLSVHALAEEVMPLGAHAMGTAAAVTAIDIDFDGGAEIIAGGGDVVQTIKWNAAASAFSPLASQAYAITAATSISVAPDDRGNDFVLAVGVGGGPNVVFEVSNDEGIRELFVAPDSDQTTSVAQADLDGDGEPDLAVGNRGQPSEVYRQGDWNGGGDRGPDYEVAWSSPQAEPTTAVAWGDIDLDGDPDLAIGNDGAPNRIFRNDSGQLVAAWSSAERDPTRSLAWLDHDGDGDLDLAAGNDGAPHRIYRNDGDTFVLAWSAPIVEPTRAIAWTPLPPAIELCP